MLENTWVLVVGLALTWFLQLYLTSLQMRRYYGRIAALRREGQVWVGLAGSAWRRRTYAVMVVGPDRRVQRVEQLSGWTVLAKLKDVPGVADYTVEKIAAEKAGILKPGRPAVCYDLPASVRAVFEKKAGETGSPLVFSDFTRLVPLDNSRAGQSFSYNSFSDLRLPLLGRHQL